jgi:DNA-directed RNA polymerase subunit RPC12/RpoP
METEDGENLCAECGSRRFKAWERLTPDERMVAGRKLGLPDGEAPRGGLFCARCLARVDRPGGRSAHDV